MVDGDGRETKRGGLSSTSASTLEPDSEEPSHEPSKRTPSHPRRRLLVAVAGLVVAVWAILAGRSLLLARQELTNGIDSADSARAHLTFQGVTRGTPIAPLRSARSDFAQAHGRLTSPMLLGLRVVPVIGRQLQSLSTLSAAATKVSDVAINGASDVQTLLNARTQGLSNEAQTARALATIAQRAQRQLNGISLGPRNGLIPSLAHARNTMAVDLNQFDSAASRGAVGARALTELLQGPHRYLVFAANNAEMRAGSGMFLSAGVLTTGPNGIQLGSFQTVTTIPIPSGSVPLVGDFAARWGWLAPNQEWRNLMLSPRFDISAPLAAQMWVAAGNGPVDGVIALDAVTVQGLLEATGPVAVGGGQIDSSNVIEELLHGQYLQFASNQVDQPGPRREELGIIAQATFQTLATRGGSRSLLVDGLVHAALGRHIMLWSRDPSEEAGWQALGVDGTVHQNSLMVSILNRGGNKLDYFLHVSSSVAFTSQGRDTAVTVTISMDNRVPPGQPKDVAGPGPNTGAAAGVYVGLASLTMPVNATGGHFDGVGQLAVAGSDGPTQVMAFPFELAAGQQRTIVAHFLLPERAGSIRVEPSARVPGISWSAGQGDNWSDALAHTVAWKLAG